MVELGLDKPRSYAGLLFLLYICLNLVKLPKLYMNQERLLKPRFKYHFPRSSLLRRTGNIKKVVTTSLI